MADVTALRQRPQQGNAVHAQLFVRVAKSIFRLCRAENHGNADESTRLGAAFSIIS